ncbi:uncharacterized protein LOC121430795 isoform X2 [Lytechinus variegatus]|uniref:uncharacterized protein LOC121430795 isoform X2 n=1 Tax=Lytechinus variegatus TaxID=7654 RepID=UPI001BB28F97|nr:uncharacterized protein LOC121430795 isoform X2 [Lytechinus variegatus]
MLIILLDLQRNYYFKESTWYFNKDKMETFAGKSTFMFLVFVICLHTTFIRAEDSTILTVTLPGDFTTDLSSPSNAVDGGWSDWGDWHSCTQSCEGGLTVRFRRCNNPTPSNGGANCTGFSMEQGACNTDPCPVDGAWSSYSDWGDCSVTCGGGNQTRTRTCSDPAPAYGGANCTGEDIEVRVCGEGICPTHGGWSDWGSYSLCNTDCQKTRYRTCTNPAPKDGGMDCAGSEVDVSYCSVLDCPVNGEWSEWSVSSCDETCRGRKRRTCSNPPPLRGGADCVGPSQEEYGACTGFKCVQNGAWSDWSPWSDCSKTCDRGGVSHRRRHCNNPHPRNGGKDCPASDPDYEEKKCFSHPCPVPPDFVRHVKHKTYNINWALILSILFGILGVLTISLIIGLCLRQRQLKIKRQQMLEEREKDKLYKEAAEMSIIPDGKKSAAEKLRRQKLKAKLKKNGKLDETEGLLDDEEDFGLLDDYWKSDSSSLAGSLSRSGSLRSRSGSMRSKSGSTVDLRPGTATDRPGTSLERPGSSAERPGSALEAGPDSGPRGPSWNPDATSWEAQEDTLIKMDDEETSQALPDGEKKRKMRRRRRRRPGNVHRVSAVIEQHAEPFDLAQDATDENRVATPDMMQHLMQLDAQLKEMAGHQVSQTTGGVTGGIVPQFAGLTDILGAPLTDVMQAPSSNVGMNLRQAMNGKTANEPSAPIAAPPNRGAPLQATPDKGVGAANKPQAAAGMNLQQAMGGKGAQQNAPSSQQHQSLGGKGAQQPNPGGMTMQQATGGKVASKPNNEQSTGGITLHDAFNGKSSGKQQAAQQGQQSTRQQQQRQPQQQQQQRGGMTMEQATGGKTAARPRSSSRDSLTVQQAAGGNTAVRPRSSPQGSVTIEKETGVNGAVLPRTPQRGGMTMQQATGGKSISPRGGAGFTSSIQPPPVKAGWTTGGSITLQQAMGPKIAPPTGVSKSRSYDSIIREAMGANNAAKKPRRASLNVIGLTRERSDLNQFNKHYGELPKDDIELEQEIAEGAYGSIHRASVWLPDQKEDEEPTSVLIKVLNRNVSSTSKAAYIKEIETMKKLKSHPNVIAFVGCCTKSDPFFMILEYASKGPLQTFLRRNRPGTPGAKPPPAEIFLRFAIHTAKGMTFLQTHKVAHGELTSRNILLNDYLRAKVSNTHRIRDPTDVVNQGRMGVRWMSPEVLAGGSYTPENDVWSFGILLWELVCFGATPYPGMSSRDVKTRIPSGLRLEQPPHCPDESYEIMKSCWQTDPNQRPSFRILVHELEKLGPQEFIDVSRFVPTRYEYM